MRVLCFDTETTSLVGNGLLPLAKQPSIIEWAGILAEVSDKGSILELERHEVLINPGKPITEFTTKITNITNAMLDGAPTWQAAAPAILKLMGRTDAFVGQNLMFDVDAVTVEMQRIEHGWKFPTEQQRYCTVEIHEFPLGRRYNLSDLHAHHFGAAHGSAHRAMPDVEATLRCFAKAVEKGYV